MKASEQTAKGGERWGKCLAQLRGEEFSWECPTLNQQQFAAAKISKAL